MCEDAVQPGCAKAESADATSNRAVFMVAIEDIANKGERQLLATKAESAKAEELAHLYILTSLADHISSLLDTIVSQRDELPD